MRMGRLIRPVGLHPIVHAAGRQPEEMPGVSGASGLHLSVRDRTMHPAPAIYVQKWGVCMNDIEIGLRAVGAICVLAGISCMAMGALNRLQRSLPVRAERLEKIRNKQESNERLSRDEEMDEKLDRFELKLPAAGALMFGLGMILFIVGG
jgi:hypothetical protein